MHLGQSKVSAATSTHNWTIGHRSKEKSFDYIVNMPWKLPSMERQRFEAFHFGKSRGYATRMMNNRTTGRFSRRICLQQDHNNVPTWAATEHQQLLHWNPGLYNQNGMQIYHNEPIGSLYWQQSKCQYRVCLLQLSAHGASPLRSLHSNQLQYAVPKWRFTRSVVALCPCIQHHKYACSVWLIWLFSL